MSARNDITCGVLANVKGDGTLFRDGYDMIFVERKRERYIPPPLPLPEEPAQIRDEDDMHD
jgi:hypothetical protein